MATISEVEYIEFGLYGDHTTRHHHQLDIISPNPVYSRPCAWGLYDDLRNNRSRIQMFDLS